MSVCVCGAYTLSMNIIAVSDNSVAVSDLTIAVRDLTVAVCNLLLAVSDLPITKYGENNCFIYLHITITKTHSTYPRIVKSVLTSTNLLYIF